MRRFALFLASGLVASALPAQQQYADVTVAQFRTLNWLEGTWRGEGGGVPPFFERYRVIDDSTIRSFELDSLGSVRDSGTIALRGGRVTSGNYGVVHLADGIVHFAPMRSASNSFSWQHNGADQWTAELRWPATAARAERKVTYVMRRLPLQWRFGRSIADTGGVRWQPGMSAVDRARADSARLPWTEADARFMNLMIGHHAQAVVMSRLAPTRAARDDIKRLAARIINAQQDEITLMQRWLRNRNLAVPDPFAAAQDHSHHTAGAMPGMLTAAQLAELEAARGKEFDRLFLIFMIQHHRGATSMVNELFGTPGAGQDEATFKFASDVHVDQVTEIARMQKLLLDVTLGVSSQ